MTDPEGASCYDPQRIAGSSYGGARVDEMLPPEELAELIEKMTSPHRRSRISRLAGGSTVSEQVQQTGEIDE